MTRSSETQKKILSAASEILINEGMGKLSVRSISKLAGVSTIGIYHHFNDKQGVLDALRLEGFQIYTDAINDIDEDQDPLTIIIKGIENYLQIALKYPAHYTLMFEPIAHGYEPTVATQQAAEVAFKKIVDRVVALPELNTSARTVAIEIWALTHGFVGLKEQVTESKIVTPAQWKKMVLDAVLAHIKSKQSKSN